MRFHETLRDAPPNRAHRDNAFRTIRHWGRRGIRRRRWLLPRRLVLGRFLFGWFLFRRFLPGRLLCRRFLPGRFLFGGDFPGRFLRAAVARGRLATLHVTDHFTNVSLLAGFLEYLS